MPLLASSSMELSFADYDARQRQELTASGLRARAEKCTPSGKFRFEQGQWRSASYIGHAVVAMVGDEPAHAPLVNRLTFIQGELARALPVPGTLYPLPSDSFHQTIANTLSAERHVAHVVERGLEESYPRRVTGVFADIPEAETPDPVTMRMLGVSIFGQAIGVLGVFDDEASFQRVLHFRNHFYGHRVIHNLGIRRTRPFIGHITVAYIERPLDEDDRRRLVGAAETVNGLLAGSPPVFYLRQAELRAYAHLAEFRALPGLPSYRL